MSYLKQPLLQNSISKTFTHRRQLVCLLAIIVFLSTVLITEGQPQFEKNVQSEQKREQYKKDLQRLNEEIRKLINQKDDGSGEEVSLLVQEEIQEKNVTVMQNSQQESSSKSKMTTYVFKDEVVDLAENQFVEFEYPHIENIVGVEIREQIVDGRSQGDDTEGEELRNDDDETDKNKGAPRQSITKTPKSCLIQDPELKIKRLIHVNRTMQNHNLSSKQIFIYSPFEHFSQHLVFLDSKGLYKLLIHQFEALLLYEIQIRIEYHEREDKGSQKDLAELILIKKFDMKSFQKVDEQQSESQLNSKSYDEGFELEFSQAPYLLKYQGKILVFLDFQFYELAAKEGGPGDNYETDYEMVHFATIKGKAALRQSLQQQKSRSDNFDDQIIIDQWQDQDKSLSFQEDSSPFTAKTGTTQLKPIIKFEALDSGLVVQYENWFDIWTLESQSQFQKGKSQQSPGDSSVRPQKYIFAPGNLNRSHIKTLLSHNRINDLEISSKLNHHNGYRLIVLVEKMGLIQFQYGAYTSINSWKVPYGDTVKQFTIKGDIIELIFGLSLKNKKIMSFELKEGTDDDENGQSDGDLNEELQSLTYPSTMRYYVAQMELNHDSRGRNGYSNTKPSLKLNRFYNDPSMREVKKIFITDDELIFVGGEMLSFHQLPINVDDLLTRQQQTNINTNANTNTNTGTSSKLFSPFTFPLHSHSETPIDIVLLQRYSQGLKSILLTIGSEGIDILEMKKNNMSIKCQAKGREAQKLSSSLQNTFSTNLTINIYQRCCLQGSNSCSNSNDLQNSLLQMSNLCHYIGHITLRVKSQTSNRLQVVKRYLIICLIVALCLTVMVLFCQIRKNRYILKRLNTMKEKIKSKYSDLELGNAKRRREKGKKISSSVMVSEVGGKSQRFDDLNEEEVGGEIDDDKHEEQKGTYGEGKDERFSK